MDRKKLVLLLGALIIAIGTAFAARSMFAGASAPVAEAAPVVPEGPKVLVAKRALPVGTIITADAIGYQLWPQEMVQDAYCLLHRRRGRHEQAARHRGAQSDHGG
jgi:pilus assembly protein CpaB